MGGRELPLIKWQGAGAPPQNTVSVHRLLAPIIHWFASRGLQSAAEHWGGPHFLQTFFTHFANCNYSYMHTPPTTRLSHTHPIQPPTHLRVFG